VLLLRWTPRSRVRLGVGVLALMLVVDVTGVGRPARRQRRLSL
jgi:hypothetical protein